MAVTPVATGAGTYAGSAEVSIVLDTSPVEDDVIVAFVGAQTGAALALDTEWENALGGSTIIQTSDVVMAAAAIYHVVTSAEDAANQTTWLVDNLWTGGETGEWAAVALRGVNLAAVVAASAIGESPNLDNPQILPAIASGSVANTGDLVLRAIVKDAAGSYTTPAGHTQRAASGTAQGVWMGTRDAATTAATAVAATNITVSAGDEYCAVTLIITAAGGGGPTQHPVSGTVPVVTTTTGSPTSLLTASGSAPVVSATSAAPTSRQGVAGSAPVVSTATGAPTLLAPVLGSIPVVSTATASPTLLAPVSGSVPVVSTVAGTAEIGGNLAASGAVVVTSTASGAPTSRQAVASSVVVVSTVTGTAELGGSLAVSGTVAVSSTASGSANLRAAAVGVIVATTTASGEVTARLTMAGVVAVVSSVAGSPAGLTSVSGVVVVVSVVSGVTELGGWVGGVTPRVLLAVVRQVGRYHAGMRPDHYEAKVR